MYLKVTSYDVREEKLKLWLFLLKVMNILMIQWKRRKQEICLTKFALS